MIKQTKTKQKIIGENIIINGGRVSFLYAVPAYNYVGRKVEEIENHIEKLYSIIEILNNKTPGLSFCLSNLQIPMTISELKEDLLKNIRKWKPEYRDDELKYIERINVGCYTLFVLEIFADFSANSDLSIKETVESFLKTIENSISQSVDLDMIFRKEREYENILHNFGCGRLTQYTTFRYLLMNYFPGIYFYNTSFSHMKYNTVLNSIYQEYSFKMEEFESYNNFITIFGLKPKTKYCSILQYTDFPTVTSDYGIALLPDNLKIFVKVPDQKKILMQMKRQRQDLAYMVKDTKDADISHEINTAQLFNTVINRLKEGILGCEMSVVQLVEADSKEELLKKRTDIIVNALNSDTIARPFLDQYKALKTFFIDRGVIDYEMMSDLRYALSLRLDSSISIGDFDSKDGIGLMRIGEEC